MTTVNKETPLGMKPKRKRHLILVLALAGVSFLTGAVWHWSGRAARHDRQKRTDAISRVREIFEDRPSLEEQLKVLRSGDSWFTENLILMRDGDWLVYHSQCGRKSPGTIQDLFIGKGSDGKWYASSWHFCSSIMNLETEGQPASLAAMQMGYFLIPFDGTVENCPEETWFPKTELVKRGGFGTATESFPEIFRAEVTGATWKRARILLHTKLYELNDDQLKQLEGYTPGSISGACGGGDEHYYSLFRENSTEKKELRIVIRRDSGLTIEYP